MTDGTETPVEQNGATPPPQQQEKPVDWEARYKGSVRKVEELTIRVRDLEAQLAGVSSEKEQYKAQLGTKDVEKDVAVGERDKLLQTAVQEKSRLETELAELRGLKLKVEVIRELGRPELIRIADRIPAMTDKEALKTVLQDFAGFADDLVQQREKQLLAGVTPPPSSGGSTKLVLPASEGEWEKHINALPLGSKERAKAFDDYYGWLEQKHK